MPTTNHTVTTRDGSTRSVAVGHSRCAAVQYDFYIPTAIWDMLPVQTFLTVLQSMEAGATVFNGTTGVWQGEPERTRIYRLILRADHLRRNDVADALEREVGDLMANLSLTPQHQQAFMYTEAEIEMNLSGLP